MKSVALKPRAFAFGIVSLPLLIAACGSTSKSSTSSTSGSSAFVSSANAACASAFSTQGAVYESMGEQYKVGTPSWAAGLAAGQAKALKDMLATLQGLTPPSGQAAMYKTLLNYGQQDVADLNQASAAAIKGDSAAYQSAESKGAAVTAKAEELSAQMGLASCADNGLSGSDKAQITHVIAYTSTVGNPAECTQNFTAAYIKQAFGSMSACVQDQKHATSPVPKSVTVTGIKGAGDFATADAVYHLTSGKSQKVSFAVFRQNGSWRLVGFQMG